MKLADLQIKTDYSSSWRKGAGSCFVGLVRISRGLNVVFHFFCPLKCDAVDFYILCRNWCGSRRRSACSPVDRGHLFASPAALLL